MAVTRSGNKKLLTVVIEDEYFPCVWFDDEKEILDWLSKNNYDSEEFYVLKKIAEYGPEVRPKRVRKAC